MARARKNQSKTTPYSILIDTREQFPYEFKGIKTDAKDGSVPLIVQTEVATLKTGDYSIDGLEHLICVERKSLEDAFGTFGAGRERFERELGRMGAMQFAAVVIESTLEEAIRNPPIYSELPPKSVFRSTIAWSQRYGVHFWWAGSRFLAERVTFRLLDRFWWDIKEGKREPQ